MKHTGEASPPPFDNNSVHTLITLSLTSMAGQESK
jgi:hypothetical protein